MRLTLTVGGLVALAAASPLAAQFPAASSTPALPTAPGAALATTVFERPNGLLLHPMTATFALSLASGGTIIPMGIRTVQVTEVALAGTPAWLIAETRSGTAVPTSDSLTLARADLTPVRWAASVGRATMASSLTRDSLFGAMQSYQGRASFAVALPAGALLTPGMVEQIVPLLPLRDGYRAGAALVLLDMESPRTEPAELSVERSERCTVLGRSEDCWVVALRSGAIEERLWVTRSMPRVVRAEQATGGGLLVGVLAA